MRCDINFDPADSTESEPFGIDFITELTPNLTAAIYGVTMTVTNTTVVIKPGTAVAGVDVLTGTIVVAQLSGVPGGVGTYTVNQSQVVPSENMTIDAIAEVLSFTVELLYGTDPNYTSRLVGQPSFDGSLVSQVFAGAQPGCGYRLTATVLTVFGHKLTLFADIPADTSLQ